MICCCLERLGDFFVLRGWEIFLSQEFGSLFFVPRGCVIFVVSRDCVIFFVPRGCVVFFVPRGGMIFCLESLHYFLSQEVAGFFLVLKGCVIFFCPKRLRDFFGYPKRLHDFFVSRGCVIF